MGGVSHVNDDNLVLLTDLFADANEAVRLHGQCVETNVGRIDADVGQLQVILQLNRQPLGHFSSNENKKKKANESVERTGTKKQRRRGERGAYLTP